jgi:hypothetical protein
LAFTPARQLKRWLSKVDVEEREDLEAARPLQSHVGPRLLISPTMAELFR